MHFGLHRHKFIATISCVVDVLDSVAGRSNTCLCRHLGGQTGIWILADV